MMLRFSWRVLLIAALFVALGWYLHAQSPPPPPTYTIAYGVVTQSDNKCQFDVGQHTSLLLHPNGDYCVVVEQNLVGRSVRLQMVIEHVASTP